MNSRTVNKAGAGLLFGGIGGLNVIAYSLNITAGAVFSCFYVMVIGWVLLTVTSR